MTIRRGTRCSYGIISFRLVRIFTPERGPRRARGHSLQRPTESLAFDVTPTSRKGLIGSTLGPATSLMTWASSAICGSLVRSRCHTHCPRFQLSACPFVRPKFLVLNPASLGCYLASVGKESGVGWVAFAGEIRGRKPNRSHPLPFRRPLNSPKVVVMSRGPPKRQFSLQAMWMGDVKPP